MTSPLSGSARRTYFDPEKSKAKGEFRWIRPWPLLAIELLSDQFLLGNPAASNSPDPEAPEETSKSSFLSPSTSATLTVIVSLPAKSPRSSSRQRVFQQVLDGPAQRTGAEFQAGALLDQQLLGFVGQDSIRFFSLSRLRHLASSMSMMCFRSSLSSCGRR